MSAATRGGQFSQASRSRRARSKTIAVARARSTTSPFIFCNRTRAVCAFSASFASPKAMTRYRDLAVIAIAAREGRA